VSAAPQAVETGLSLEAAVRLGLEDYGRAQARAARRYGPDFVALWDIAAQTMGGGKLVRPLLMAETVAGFARARSGAAVAPATVIDAAVAVELLHYAFVLHDDVIDGDLMRRGRPNLIGTVAAQHPARHTPAAMHWATTAGILMGDLALSGVYQTFARLDVTSQAKERLFTLLDHAITETVAGEFADVGLADGCLDPELGTILAMSANKTATYSFAWPLRIASVLAGQGREVEEALASAGRHLGLAFQLQDDVLSTFGDPARHGKDPNSDLREGKQTALIAFARMTPAWRDIEGLLAQDSITDAHADALRAHLEACGARRFVEGLVDESMDAFRAACADPASPIPPQVRAVLADAADRLHERQS